MLNGMVNEEEEEGHSLSLDFAADLLLVPPAIFAAIHTRDEAAILHHKLVGIADLDGYVDGVEDGVEEDTLPKKRHLKRSLFSRRNNAGAWAYLISVGHRVILRPGLKPLVNQQNMSSDAFSEGAE